MSNTNTIAHQNEIQMIIDALVKKSKRSFSHRQESLKEQALYFSPPYRDFIYKVIKNNALKIVNSWEGYISPREQLIYTSNLRKKQKNVIHTDIRRVDVLPHELGHAVDFWFGHYQALSTNVILSNGKTLKDIFFEEFESKQEEIYKTVMSEYKTIINSNINDKAYSILTKYMSDYQKLRSIKCNLEDKKITKQRRKIQKYLYDVGFVEAYYLLYDKKCFAILNQKYSPILDALSSKYDFDGLFLSHHELIYYERFEDNAVFEFFANLFEAKVTSKQTHFDNLVKFLPKSFEAFEELFNIFYNRIQQNKKFTDVKIIRR